MIHTMAVVIFIAGCQSNPTIDKIAIDPTIDKIATEEHRSPEFDLLRSNAEIAGTLGEAAEKIVRDEWASLVWTKSDDLTTDTGTYVDSSTGLTMIVVKGATYEYYGEATDANENRFGCSFAFDQDKSKGYKSKDCGQSKGPLLNGWGTRKQAGKIEYLEYHNGKMNGPSLICQCQTVQCTEPVNCIERWYSENELTLDRTRKYPLHTLLDVEVDFSNLVRIDPVPQAQQYVQQEKYAEAADYLSYFIDYDYVKEDSVATQLYNHIKDTRDSEIYKLKKMSSGFILGKSDEVEGEVAAVVSDFLVVGDLRDIGKEWAKFIRGQEVDNVALVLAAIGGVATGALLVTAGTAASVKSSISITKAAHKVGKLPKWLGTWLVEGVETAKKTQNLDHISGFFSDIRKLEETAGSRATLELLAKSKNRDDFRNLAKFGNKFGKKTTTLLKVAGDDAIVISARMGNLPKETLLEAATYGRNGVVTFEKYGDTNFQIFKRITKLERGLINSGVKAKVAGREFIKRNQVFDPKYVDARGMSNLDRMKQGQSPLGKDDLPINLHHMKQKNDGLLVELSYTEHKRHSKTLHRYKTVSEIDRDTFNILRSEYWKERAKDFG